MKTELTEKTSISYFELAAGYLPGRIAAHIKNAYSSDEVEEIRIKRNAEVAIVVSDRVLPACISASSEDLRIIIRNLCGNSVYSHSESIKDGFVVTEDGIRAGVAGRAVCEDGKISAVYDIDSVVIRIPSRRLGAADDLYGLMKTSDFRKNVLVFSPPSGGKTTLLRELTHKLTSSEYPLRVTVVDSRYEIGEGIDGDGFIRLSGYPRDKGIEIAIRSTSPDIIICDEISNERDISAAKLAAGCGATIVASCHASSKEEAAARIGDDLFDIYYRVCKNYGLS